MSTRIGSGSEVPNKYYRVNQSCTRVTEVCISESGVTTEKHYYFCTFAGQRKGGGRFLHDPLAVAFSEHEEYFYSMDELLEYVSEKAEDRVLEAFLQEFV